MSDWIRTFDRYTPYEALEAIVAHYVKVAMDDLHAQLLADDDLTDRDRAAMLAKVRPMVEAQTRGEVEKGWLSLQSGQPM